MVFRLVFVFQFGVIVCGGGIGGLAGDIGRVALQGGAELVGTIDPSAKKDIQEFADHVQEQGHSHPGPADLASSAGRGVINGVAEVVGVVAPSAKEDLQAAGDVLQQAGKGLDDFLQDKLNPHPRKDFPEWQQKKIVFATKDLVVKVSLEASHITASVSTKTGVVQEAMTTAISNGCHKIHVDTSTQFFGSHSFAAQLRQNRIHLDARVVGGVNPLGLGQWIQKAMTVHGEVEVKQLELKEGKLIHNLDVSLSLSDDSVVGELLAAVADIFLPLLKDKIQSTVNQAVDDAFAKASPQLIQMLVNQNVAEALFKESTVTLHIGDDMVTVDLSAPGELLLGDKTEL